MTHITNLGTKAFSGPCTLVLAYLSLYGCEHSKNAKEFSESAADFSFDVHDIDVVNVQVCGLPSQKPRDRLGQILQNLGFMLQFISSEGRDDTPSLRFEFRTRSQRR